MHLNKIIILFTLLLISCKATNSLPKNYEYTPVLLYLSNDKQPDSIGFNLVKSIPELVYPRIISGDLAIWENSDKRLVVGAQNFIEKEKTALSPFVRSDEIFIHEFWQLFKRNFEFGIQGFTFTGKTKAGKLMNYGYIDAKDVIDLMKNNKIPCNANGTSELTYWDALHSNIFQFRLVQFGKNDFKSNLRMSPALQYQAIYDPKIFHEFTAIPAVKSLEYKVLTPSINYNIENATIYNALEKYVNDNKQTILNATSVDHFYNIMFLPWKIDNISFEEKWSLYKDIPFQELINMKLFIDKHEIILTKKQVEELGIKINFQGLEEYLSEKRFSFLLEKINDQEILPQQSETYYKKLLTKDWNHIK